MGKDDVIIFSAAIAQVKTLVDGGIRITLDLGEREIDTAAKLMLVKSSGAILAVSAVAIKAKHGRKQKHENSGNSEPTY